MPTLSQAQIAQVARAGGLPGDPGVWAAIAMAESSGRTDVVNSIGCVGLWQINQRAHVGSHPTWTVAWLQNPVNNARAAATIYASQGFSAWEAYTGPDGKGSDGPWKNYYRAGGGVVQAGFSPWDLDPFGLVPGNPNKDYAPDNPFGGDPPYSGIPDAAAGAGDALGTIAEGVQKGAVWISNPKHWVSIGYVVGGGVLVLMGLAIIAKPLLNATPAGRVAKAAGTAVKTKVKARKTARAAAKAGGSDEGDDEGGDE